MKLAIVGIDCRFPGAVNKNAFWDLLVRGEHGLSPVPAQRWDAGLFYSPTRQPGTTNTRIAGFISDPDAFDHEFFGISPREAAAMDPQQRLLLPAAWRALEDAGMAPNRQAGTATGVYVGIMSSEWANLHMTDYAGLTAQRGSGNGYCMAANRISYHLDLRGPSMAVDTACSSSLVALHTACSALRAGDCDQALVAGVNLLLTPALSIFYREAGLSAPDGRCKPFSAGADGIGRGEGVGVVVVRRLADALADRQPVYAVIESSAVNSDGRSNGLTAPNRWSQRQVVATAYQRAGVAPADMWFVEGHGTGTLLGDMIEVRALGDVHRVDRERPCLLGSVKSNIGHAEGAAGIAGLIKACLALERRTLPPTISTAGENPELRLAEHGLRLVDRPTRLPKGTVYGGVSSFGLGGTNAHVVLSTPPVRREPVEPQAGGVLTLSANTEAALHRNVVELSATVAREPAERLAQLCHSTNIAKSTQRYRIAVPLSTPDQLRADFAMLADDPAAALAAAGRPGGAPTVAFLYTGQGSQYPGMTAALYQGPPAYRARFDEADAVLTPLLEVSVADLLFGPQRDGLCVDDTRFTQPALFCVQYAMTAALADLGVTPDIVVGHSIGEYAAACATGRLTLAEAAAMVVARGRLMQALPAGGAMTAVHCPEDVVRRLVADEPTIAIAAVNGPQDVVVSGADDAVRRIVATLSGQGIRTRPLPVSHAFHSPLMTPMLRPFADAIGTVPRRPLSATFVSTVYAREVEAAELDTTYWVDQVRAPVRFADALHVVSTVHRPTHVVEIGPRPVLVSLARRAGLRDAVTLSCCPGERANGAELGAVAAALYRAGVDVDFRPLYRPGQRTLRRLPPYVFADDARFWASAATVGTTVTTVDRAVPAVPSPAVGSVTAPREARRAQPAGAPTDVGAQVLAAIAEVGDYPVTDLHTGTRLRDDLGYDSIMVMQLGDLLAELFTDDRPLPLHDLLPRISTVGDLVSFVAEQWQDTSTTTH